MGKPGSDGQLTISPLANAGMSEMAIKGGGPTRDPGPTHICVDGLCSMVNDCGWLRRWHAAAGGSR